MTDGRGIAAACFAPAAAPAMAQQPSAP